MIENKASLLLRNHCYAAFTLAGLTNRYRRKACIKVFLCCQTRAIFSLWRDE